jgi:uncharacterized membrane protein YdjX (TVP38/TMEM64 family)
MAKTTQKASSLTHSRKEFIQGACAFIFFVALIYLGMRLISTENIREKVDGAGLYGPLVFILFKASTNIIAPLGGNPFYLIAPQLFGFTDGFIYLLVGDLLGYTTSFFLSRVFGRAIMRVLFSDKQLDRFDTLLHDVESWKGLALLALAFFGFADFVSYGAGLTKIPYWKYILTATPPMLLKIAILMLIGETFIINQKSFLAVMAAITILPFVVMAIRKFFKRKASS